MKKCLLNDSLACITIEQKTPDPNRLQYLAAPDSTKGIVVDGSDTSLQRLFVDPLTGSISIKSKHFPTLRLLDFATFLSVIFRAIDMDLRETPRRQVHKPRPWYGHSSGTSPVNTSHSHRLTNLPRHGCTSPT